MSLLKLHEKFHKHSICIIEIDHCNNYHTSSQNIFHTASYLF